MLSSIQLNELLLVLEKAKLESEMEVEHMEVVLKTDTLILVIYQKFYK